MKVLYIATILLLIFTNISGQELDCNPDNNIPFSTNNKSLTIWNGHSYSPVLLNGVNLGVSIPGTFPGELAASRQQYWNWFEEIKESGFNNIRIYTLHYPRFYQVLDSFNLQNQQSPLYVFHGVWLDEELEGYNKDLYYLTDTFNLMLEEVIDCIHGNKIIEPRFGKAFGNYNTDASKWIFAYIIGRETHPDEVMITNELHSNQTSFNGEVFSLDAGNPSEIWITARLDHLVKYERQQYQTERPVSYSNWPTLDPIEHPTEIGWEDTVHIDLAEIDFSLAPAGYFATYHAYPYYPDFISNDPVYQSFEDYIGQNSYLGYLSDLKNHYNRYPLIIAEYGVPSSWGSAHYSSSGMHHGGMSELEQGIFTIRMMNNIVESGCGGGMYFAWIDEWFKRTWITDPIDFNPERRVLWHNITAAEQNFGLKKFESNNTPFQTFETFNDTCPISEVSIKTDFSFFSLKLNIKNELTDIDTIWLAIDTYSFELGEAILPGGEAINNRAEFLLKITNFSAELFVTQAYDLFGIWHGISPPEQLYHSIPTNGAPWNIVRWKNNQPNHEIQYIGDLELRRTEMPSSSNDAVIISNEDIEIRLPWSLLQVIDPSTMSVIHDDRSTSETEDTISDGIAFSILHNNCIIETSGRYMWEVWSIVENVEEVEKQSLQFITSNISQFNANAIAVCDNYVIDHSNGLAIETIDGILSNDFDIDGKYMNAEVTEYPSHGELSLSADGSFSYYVDPGFSGIDYFKYQIFDGYNHSDTSFVIIDVNNTGVDNKLDFAGAQIYPNPANDKLTVLTKNTSDESEIRISNISGTTFINQYINNGNNVIDVSSLLPGYYLIFINTKNNRIIRKLIII